MEDEWKIIPDLECSETYECNKSGIIRNHKTKYVLKQNINADGYVKVSLVDKQYSAHRLIAKTWIPNPENKPTVNHNNHNRSDNNVDNLSWATYSEQNILRRPFENKKNRVIYQIDKENNNIINTFNSLKDATIALKLPHHGKLSECANGKRNTAYGFKWKYDEIINEPDEIWKVIEDNYEVSSIGRVKSGNLLLKLRKTNYYRIHIGKRIERVHRLVAKAFVENPNPEIYNIVNHKDGNKYNNHYTNLEWCTHQMNIIHSIETGLYKSKKVTHFDKHGKIIKIYRSVAEAAKELDIDYGNIHLCCMGKQVSCKRGMHLFKFWEESDKNIIKIPKLPHIRAVLVTEPSGNIIRYNTIREVVKQYNLNPRRVIKYLNGYYPDTEKLRIVYE